MTKIPSTEKTDDSIFRFQIKKYSTPDNPSDPHALGFDHFFERFGTFHSMDVTVMRDGHDARDVEFLSFEHNVDRKFDLTHVRFRFRDEKNRVVEHDYIFTVIVRYLI